ncbi:GTPase Era [Candidatus Johnevansia muelleri]|uniref:GTPase Era n=1 Tax=Candidatus Johnevansia muelleri TaxID=1495769 RepID=A0A078KHL8_9GAMM|nr:GTPase Era [Candidatus Evansia muelleri]
MNIIKQKTLPVQRCGFVTVIGRTNVGKSTLINYILGKKISITSRRPHTTRNKILGVKTEGNTQIIYVDTPGMHLMKKYKNYELNFIMNRTAFRAINDVDCIIFIIDRLRWTEEDNLILNKINNISVPVIAAVNKIDWIKEKLSLLPWFETLYKKYKFVAILPISGKTGLGINKLESVLANYIPYSKYFFPKDQSTDKNNIFLSSEIIREKVIRYIGDELPYQITVVIDDYKISQNIIYINALIVVERKAQKKIIIGAKGIMIKRIGRDARLDLERLLSAKVILKLWVKIKRSWYNDKQVLNKLGYDVN